MKTIALTFLLTLSFSALAKHPDLRSLDAQATLAAIPNVPLYCEFWALGYPKSWSVYDPTAKTVWLRTGYPRKTTVFTNVLLNIGGAPYGDYGFTLLAFGDVPLFSVLMKAPIDNPFLAFLGQIFDPGLHATWARFPGGPTDIVNGGYCGIGRTPPFEDFSFNGW